MVRLVGKQGLSMVSMTDDQERSLHVRFPCMPAGGFRALKEMSEAWDWRRAEYGKMGVCMDVTGLGWSDGTGDERRHGFSGYEGGYEDFGWCSSMEKKAGCMKAW